MTFDSIGFDTLAATLDALQREAHLRAIEVVATARVEPGLVPPGYDILGFLGRGGMGIVYKAQQVKAGRVVALKVILSGGHATPDNLARFRSGQKLRNDVDDLA